MPRGVALRTDPGPRTLSGDCLNLDMDLRYGDCLSVDGVN